MGMNTHVIGIRPATTDYAKKVAAWDACVAAGIDVPDELMKYFEGEGPNPDGMEVELEDTDCVEEYNEEMRDGFTVDVRKLPEGVCLIRFYNSY